MEIAESLSLLIPECKDKGVSLGQSGTKLKTAHGQQKYHKIVLLEDEEDLGVLPGICRSS